MKKLLALFALFAALILVIPVQTYSQGTIVDDYVITLADDTIKGAGATLTIYTNLLDEYWDHSIQFKSTFNGTADSSYFAVAAYQTNDPNQSVWTEITALRDTLNTATDVQGIIVTKTDFGGMWMKYILTGLATDSVIIVPYVVNKQKRSRFF